MIFTGIEDLQVDWKKWNTEIIILLLFSGWWKWKIQAKNLKLKILEIHPTYGSRLFIGQLSDTYTFTFERDSVCTNSIFNRFKISQSVLAKLFRIRDHKKIEIVIFESDFQRFQFLIFSIFLH